MTMTEVDLADLPRPHFNKLTTDLEALVADNWSDIPVLAEALVELLHRKRNLALQLRKKVVARIIELQQQSESFKWPSTDALSGSGQVTSTAWPQVGLLSFLGYSVGSKGVPHESRRALLDDVYLEPVPQVDSEEYMSEWGAPKSGTRLKKIAESIAAFTRNAKRSTKNMDAAISAWESDLDYLKNSYYIGRYDFLWPDTYV